MKKRTNRRGYSLKAAQRTKSRKPSGKLNLRPLLYLAAATLVVFLSVRGVGLLAKSGYFTVKEPVITGNSKISDEKIKLWSGLSAEKSIFKINLREVLENIKKTDYFETVKKGDDPDKLRIKKVTIRRSLPSTIVIDVTEREPLAYTIINGDPSWGIDAEGAVFPVRGGHEGDSLPVITGIDFSTEPPSQAAAKLARFRKFVENAGMIRYNSLSGMISEINLEPSCDITLVTYPSGTKVFLNLDGGIPESILKLRKIVELANPAYAGSEYIDLRYDSIYYKSKI